jgi:signal transduction histidine kinase/CheY-like chemotaxis protein
VSVPVPEILLAALRVLPEATVLLSGAGEILAANAPARDALGLASERPEGARLDELTAPPKDKLALYLRMCARSRDLLPGAFSVQRRSSAPVAYLCRGALIAPRAEEHPSIVLLRFWAKDEDGNPFVLLNQKITELTREISRRRAMEEALRQSEAAFRDRALEAESLSRSKDEFLATLSHELRTPLNAVLGWAQMLRDGRLSEEQRVRAVDTIERNARAQSQLIEELLDISRIITGKLRLNVQQVDPIGVVEAAVDGVRPAAEAKGIQLQVVLDPQAGPIMGDPDRLQQICWNLLSNALKFTPKKGRVQVILERVDSNVEITVADSGAGIAPDFLPYVFERFRQQDPSITRRFGGLGLGLSIVKSLAELHGGQVRVHSEGEGRGATFVVRLPRALVKAASGDHPFASASLPAKGRPDCPPEFEGLRIVVVDDEPDALEMLIVLLEHCGAHVKACRTAGEAFEAVQSVRPDVLISDIGMPDEDGYRLIQRIRELPPSAGGRTPAIALTAFARAEDRTRALRVGFQTHVVKPIEPAELLAVVASLVHRFSEA